MPYIGYPCADRPRSTGWDPDGRTRTSARGNPVAIDHYFEPTGYTKDIQFVFGGSHSDWIYADRSNGTIDGGDGAGFVLGNFGPGFLRGGRMDDTILGRVDPDATPGVDSGSKSLMGGPCDGRLDVHLSIHCH